MVFARKVNPETCPKCPNRYAPRGCPCWMEVIETNDAGEKRITRGCYYEIMMRWMGDVVKASMGAAAASNDTRNKVLGGLLGLAEHMQSAKLQGPAITINAIEGPTDGAETQSSN